MFSIPKRQRARYDSIEKFRLPVIAKGKKDVYVYFYVLDPDSILDGEPRLVRVRHRFNRIKSARERMAAARRFCEDVSAKLLAGWNPLIEASGKVSFKTIDTVLDEYQRYLEKSQSDGSIRQDSLIDYVSRINILRAYNSQLQQPALYVYQIDSAYVESFLDYIYIKRNAKPITRNNYLSWMRSLCHYMRSRGYLSADPTEGIRRLRVGQKERKPLAADAMHRLKEYLKAHDPHYLLACMVHYYTLIRPKEMSYVRISDISVKEQTIFIHGEHAKNHADAKVTVPRVVLLQMLELGIFSNPGSYYLFGSNFMPSAERASEKIYRDRWAKVRKACGFPSSYKFYSLKDTGITDAIEKVGLVVAKDQARHSDISITSVYVRKEQLRAQPELKDFEGQL